MVTLATFRPEEIKVLAIYRHLPLKFPTRPRTAPRRLHSPRFGLAPARAFLEYFHGLADRRPS
jgi:hypothetical protein